MAQPLTPAELGSLTGKLPAWRIDGGSLTRTYRFRDFRTAMGFMASCTDAIDRGDHHPEWTNSYDRVSVILTSHDAGDAITAQDVALATLLDRVYQSPAATPSKGISPSRGRPGG